MIQTNQWVKGLDASPRKSQPRLDNESAPIQQPPDRDANTPRSRPLPGSAKRIQARPFVSAQHGLRVYTLPNSLLFRAMLPPCPSRPPPVRRERVKPSSRAKRSNPLPRSDYYSPFPPPTFFSKAEIGVSPETSGDKANRIQQDAGKKTPLQVLMQVVRCPDVVIEKLRNPPKLYRAVF